MTYQYKMTQIPSNFVTQDSSGNSPVAADRLEKLANDYAKQGWEFYRIDTVNVSVKPGCLAGLLGRRVESAPYCIVTFRKERRIATLPKVDEAANLPVPSVGDMLDEEIDWPDL